MLSISFQKLYDKPQRRSSALDTLKERLKDRPEELERRLQSLEAMGDSKPAERVLRYPPYEVSNSPERFENPALFVQIWEIFQAYDQHGILPYSGSLLQQPAKVIDAFTLLRNLKSDWEAKLHKEATKKQRQK